MSLNGAAYIVGAYEHPTRKADDMSVLRLHADVAKGALEDAGLTKDDIDGYFCAGDAPGLGATDHGRLPGPQAAPCRFDRDAAAPRPSCTWRTPPRRSPPAAATSR